MTADSKGDRVDSGSSSEALAVRDVVAAALVIVQAEIEEEDAASFGWSAWIGSSQEGWGFDVATHAQRAVALQTANEEADGMSSEVHMFVSCLLSQIGDAAWVAAQWATVRSRLLSVRTAMLQFQADLGLCLRVCQQHE